MLFRVDINPQPLAYYHPWVQAWCYLAHCNVNCDEWLFLCFARLVSHWIEAPPNSSSRGLDVILLSFLHEITCTWMAHSLAKGFQDPMIPMRWYSCPAYSLRCFNMPRCLKLGNCILYNTCLPIAVWQCFFGNMSETAIMFSQANRECLNCHFFQGICGYKSE